MTATNNSPSSPVRFHFKKVGPIKQADFELGDLTIIAGHNNTGKTYLVYTLYGFLKTWRRWLDSDFLFTEAGEAIQVDFGVQHHITEKMVEELIETGRARLPVNPDELNRERMAAMKEIAHAFSKAFLANVFSSDRRAFADASIDVELNGIFVPSTREFKMSSPAGGDISLRYKGNDIYVTRTMAKRQRHDVFETTENVASLYLQFLIPELALEPFVLSAERFGISLFYKELDFTKNRLVDLLQQMGDERDRERFSPFFFIDQATSRYALPIKDNIDYTRSIGDLQKDRSEFHEDKLFDDIKDMMDGYYRSENDDIQFRSKARKDRSFTIPLHRASSSARGLSDLYFFLRHVAKKNHLLIIDEPESHLDTANQILLARLLARCVRAGLKILITTHSDYLIKEINNLIMLSRPFSGREEIVSKLKYRGDDSLASESVRAYVAVDNTLRQCKVDIFGIDMPVFDDTIDRINTAANELASRLAEDTEV